MFKSARLNKIKEIVSKDGEVNVQSLIEILGVSGVTVRSDLEELEQQGFVLRTHGGAVLNETSDFLFYSPQENEKKEIARIASHLVENNEWIFLGPGTTCFYIAEQLMHRPSLNIITNNMRIASLSHESSANVYFAGGITDRNSLFTYGEMLTRSLEGINFSKSFLSVDGVEIESGYTVSSMNFLNIYNIIKNKTENMILVADCMKFEKKSSILLGDIYSFPVIISNEGMPSYFKEFYFNNNIKLFTSYNLSNTFE